MAEEKKTTAELEHAGKAGKSGDTHTHTHQHMHTHTHHHDGNGGENEKETKKETSTDTMAKEKAGEKEKPEERSFAKTLYDRKAKKATTAGNASMQNK
jgi:hypothetical protein